MLKSQHMLEKGSGSMRKGGAQKYISLMRYVNTPRPMRNCILHPLIHTIPPAASTQNMGVRSK